MRFLDKITSLLLPLSAILMEVFVVCPWFIWTGKWATLHWGRPPLGIFSVLSLVGISVIATRFFSSRHWSFRVIQLTVAGIGLIVVFLSIRIEYGNGIEVFSLDWFTYFGQLILDSFSDLSSIVLALPAAALLWWRGMRIGRRSDYNYISSNLIYGAGSFVVLGFIWWASIERTTFNSMATSLGLYVAGFLFFGLTGTAFSNLRNVRIRMPEGETQQISYRRWLPVVTGIVITIMGLGAIVATAASLNVGDFIKRIFGNLSGVYQTVINWLSYPLKYIFMPFEWLARTILEWLIRILGSKPLQPEGNEGEAQELPEIIPGVTPEDWLTILKWAIFIIVVVIVTVVIARSVEKNRRRKTETRADYEESRESLWNWSQLFDGLIRTLKRLFGRFITRKLASDTSHEGQISRRQGEQSAAVLKIRDIGRRRNETPYEYADRFNEKALRVSEEMNELTGLYVEVRYGESDAGGDQIEHANKLWREIRERLNQLNTEDKRS
jgi:hypothetical protein